MTSTCVGIRRRSLKFLDICGIKVVQIQLEIKHTIITNFGEWRCMVFSEICYTEQYLANMGPV